MRRIIFVNILIERCWVSTPQSLQPSYHVTLLNLLNRRSGHNQTHSINRWYSNPSEGVAGVLEKEFHEIAPNAGDLDIGAWLEESDGEVDAKKKPISSFFHIVSTHRKHELHKPFLGSCIGGLEQGLKDIRYVFHWLHDALDPLVCILDLTLIGLHVIVLHRRGHCMFTLLDCVKRSDVH